MTTSSLPLSLTLSRQGREDFFIPRGTWFKHRQF